MNIAQVQRVIGTQPDGIWGKQSQAALEDAKTQRFSRKIAAVQKILGVASDNVWGPTTQAALDALLHGDHGTWPFSIVVDGDDIRVNDIIITCFGGGFDPQDDGNTASGLSTKDASIVGVSVAMDGRQFPHLTLLEHKALDFSPIPRMPFGTLVEINIGGILYVPPYGIIDLGPGIQASPSSTEAHALDMCPSAAMHYAPGISLRRLARDFEMRGSFRIIGGAKYLNP